MDGETRFYQRPWFYPFSWTVVAGIWYLFNLYRMDLGAITAYVVFVIFDAILFFTGFFVWLGFFSQFILPVQHFRERQKIFDRLISHVMGGHGPAMFVEDGILRASKGEKEKQGAGVIWLDSASAVQLRTNTKFTRTLGPGVNFTNGGEYIAGVVDLHTQTQGLGPQGKDKPFDSKPEAMSDDEYGAIQKRRNETSALTRDGIEVVPNINVAFKIDAAPVEGNGPGSRFGYRETDKPEDNPVFRAIAGEGINPNLASQSPDKQVVAWNRLPAIIAADLWREYLSKFTLRDLFDPIHEIPPDNPPPLRPTLDETTALFEPIQIGASQNRLQEGITEVLHEINQFLIRWVNRLESHIIPATSNPKTPPPPASAGGGTGKTGLEVINAMIRARMTQERVEELDASGKRTGREVESLEYKWLKNRGLKVNAASAGSLRFTPVVEEQLVRQWNASWLNNAKAERDAIERLRKQKEFQGQEQSRRNYIHSMSKSLLKKHPAKGKDTLRHLLTGSRDELIRHDKLHRRLSNEINEIEEIIQWL